MFFPRRFALLILAPAAAWLFSPTNLATASPVTYNPPDRGAPRRTHATGTRGSCRELAANPVEISLLVPSDHTGTTSSDRPVFFWELSRDTEAPIEFAIVRDRDPEPLWVTQMPGQAGLTRVELPAGTALEVGETYRWSVALVCNRDRRSEDIFAQSWIRRDPLDPTARSQIRAATSPRDLADIYASEGLWYDALAQSYNDATLEAERLSLLEQGGAIVDVPPSFPEQQ